MSLAVTSFWRRLTYTRLRDVLRGRIDGRLDWRGAIARADLPEPIEKVVLLVLLSTRLTLREGLWKNEKLDVVEELVAHFHDGLEAGESPEALVESFGDPRQAAKLIRRAKRRCRPLSWQAWWWASRSVAALIGVYCLMAAWLATSKPKVTTDYLAKINKSIATSPVEDRAWPIYLEIARRGYVEKNGETGLTEASVYSDWEPNFEELGPEAARVWIEEHQELIELIRQAAAKPHLATPLARGSVTIGDFDLVTGELRAPLGDSFLTHTLVETLLPHIQAIRGHARVLRQDALLAAERGDGERVLADIEAMLGVAEHCDNSPFVVAGLVAIAIDGMTYDLTRGILRDTSGVFSDAQLAQLAHRVAEIDYSVGTWVDGERMMFYDIVQRVYSDNGSNDGHITAAGLRLLREEVALLTTDGGRGGPLFGSEQLAVYAAAPAAYFAIATRKETVKKYDELLNHYQANLARPLWETTAQEWRYGFDDRSETPYERIHYLPIDMLAPAMQAVSSATERGRGIREGWLIGIALELYRREKGDWPESLAPLSPRLLPSVPVDRINGAPLVYRVVDGQPLVYSRGIDGDDDLGRPPEDYREQPWNHRVEPARPELKGRDGNHPHDGDWVLWSLAPPPAEEENEAAEQELTTPH